MSLESGVGIPRELKPSRLWLESERLKPRPFKEYFLKDALVPGEGIRK